MERSFLPTVRVVLRLSWVWPWTVLVSSLFSPGRHPATSLPELLVLAGVGFGLGGTALRKGPVRRVRGFIVVLTGLVSILGLTWVQHYRSVIPILDPVWIRDLGLDIVGGGAPMARRLVAIVAGSFVCVSGAIDGEEPADHAAIWAAFTSAVTLLVVHASMSELVPEWRLSAPTPWLLLALALGVAGLFVSGSRLGERLEPRVHRPWQTG
jgi:hypothetical protein